MKKIIILASERSGTNLLRTLLGNHQDICAPVAPHFLDAFRYILDVYNHLENEEDVDKLLTHMLQLANHSYHDWQLMVDILDLKRKYKINSLATAFDALYSSKAHQENKQHYVCKDNHMFNHVDICTELEDVYYLYLYRDPRDHVASWLRTPLFMHTPYKISQKWVTEQKKVLDLEEQQKLNLIYVKYEDLIKDPQMVMTKILESINLPIDEKCFETNSNNKESNRNELWKNLSKPVMSSNQKKYKQYLNCRDLNLVETLASEFMLKLGYEFETKANWKIRSKKLFKLKEKYITHQSQIKHKELKEKTMADLEDKLKLIKSFQN